MYGPVRTNLKYVMKGNQKAAAKVAKAARIEKAKAAAAKKAEKK